MYVNKNDLTQIIQDNQAFTDRTDVEAIKYPKGYLSSIIPELALVSECVCPTDCVMIGYHIELIESIYTQVWESREYTSEEITTQKQSLLDQIDAQQRDILTIWDGWASKSKAYEDDVWADSARYETAKAWSKTVRAVNDGLSVDSDTSVLEAALVTLATLKETGKNI